MHIHAFIEDAFLAAARAMRLGSSSSPPPTRMLAACLLFAALTGAASAQGPAQGAEKSRAEIPGAVAQAPLSDRLRDTVLDSIRSQLLDAARAEIRVIVHFPMQRGDNGRVCGEVLEPGADGPRTRTFFSIYTRAGRVLTRLEDGAFEAYLAGDTVFRNCSPRL